MLRYEVLVDIYDDLTEREKEIYSAFVRNHNALLVCHEKYRNSSFFFRSETKLRKKDLERELRGIRIIEIGKEELRKAA